MLTLSSISLMSMVAAQRINTLHMHSTNQDPFIVFLFATYPGIVDHAINISSTVGDRGSARRGALKPLASFEGEKIVGGSPH